MALTLSKRQRILPMRGAVGRPPPRRIPDPINEPDDDYLVEGEDVTDQPSAAARAVRALQILLIFVLAALTLAIVWLLGLMLNIF